METQIIESEKKYWEGMENHDYETVKNLTRFPCIVASKHGVRSVDEPKFKEMFESGGGNQIKVTDISNIETQQITETTAGIAYLVTLEYQGKSMKCACTSTWVKENNHWLCALHTEAELEN